LIKYKTDKEVELIRQSSIITAKVFSHLKPFIKEGITTRELDKIAEKFIKDNGGEPSFKGYRGYRHTLCTSVNKTVVHGIPDKYKLKNGDIISVDVGTSFSAIK